MNDTDTSQFPASDRPTETSSCPGIHSTANNSQLPMPVVAGLLVGNIAITLLSAALQMLIIAVIWRRQSQFRSPEVVVKCKCSDLLQVSTSENKAYGGLNTKAHCLPTGVLSTQVIQFNIAYESSNTDCGLYESALYEEPQSPDQ